MIKVLIPVLQRFQGTLPLLQYADRAQQDQMNGVTWTVCTFPPDAFSHQRVSLASLLWVSDGALSISTEGLLWWQALVYGWMMVFIDDDAKVGYCVAR
jgi:hypothetical protein